MPRTRNKHTHTHTHAWLPSDGFAIFRARNLHAGSRSSQSIGMGSTDRDRLIALFQATKGNHWERNEGWNTSDDLSTWYGVTVNHRGRVERLYLRENNLRGKTYIYTSRHGPQLLLPSKHVCELGPTHVCPSQLHCLHYGEAVHFTKGVKLRVNA